MQRKEPCQVCHAYTAPQCYAWTPYCCDNCRKIMGARISGESGDIRQSTVNNTRSRVL